MVITVIMEMITMMNMGMRRKQAIKDHYLRFWKLFMKKVETQIKYLMKSKI